MDIAWMDDGHPIWSPINAIDFALDGIDDHYNRISFLELFRDGTVHHHFGTRENRGEWRDYLDFCMTKMGINED